MIIKPAPKNCFCAECGARDPVFDTECGTDWIMLCRRHLFQLREMIDKLEDENAPMG